MKQTAMLPKEAIQKKWLLIDAQNWVLGRLASQITHLLRGKNKPFFTPHNDCGDYVIVINSSAIVLTGQKWTQKKYYRHSQYPQGLKMIYAKQLHQTKPTALLKLAVKRMLPRNRLARQQIKHLFVYPGQNHPHQAQKPQVVNLHE